MDSSTRWGQKMLKHNKQGGAPTGIFSIFWKPTFLISFALVMLLLPLCILNSFLIFHLSLFVPRPNSIPTSASINGSIHNSLGKLDQNSPKVVLNRKQPIMQAIREESPNIFTLSNNNHSNFTPSNNHRNSTPSEDQKVLEARKQEEQIEDQRGDSEGKVLESRKQEKQTIREENPYIFTLSHNNHSSSTPSEEKVSEARKQEEQIEDQTVDSEEKVLEARKQEEQIEDQTVDSEEKVLEARKQEEEIENQTREPGNSFPKELHQNVNGSEINEEEVESRPPSDPNASLDKPPLNTSEEERIKWFTQNLASFKILHSDSLSSHFRSKVNSFFHNCSLHFFMTWISNPEAFGPRELLSVESVFKWHPSACLLIISRSMDSEIGSKILDPFVGRGFRVMAAAPDLMHLFKGTAAATWLSNVKDGKIDPGEISFAQNLSNIIRLAALHKYGGIYMDSDVIILKSMEKLENVIGAQSVDPSGQWNRLNNAVLVFEKSHPLVSEFMQEFARNFNGNKWGYNGPYLVSRVVKHLLTHSKIRFQVMPPMAFYPVDWIRIHGFFHRHSGREWIRWRKGKLLQMDGETYAVHLWNKQSRQLQVEEGSIIHHVFNKCCVLCRDKHFLHNNFTV